MTEEIENPDEFILEDVKMVHYEVMDSGDEENNNRGVVWIGIYLNNGKIYHLNIGGNNLNVNYRDETPE